MIPSLLLTMFYIIYIFFAGMVLQDVTFLQNTNDIFLNSVLLLNVLSSTKAQQLELHVGTKKFMLMT